MWKFSKSGTRGQLKGRGLIWANTDKGPWFVLMNGNPKQYGPFPLAHAKTCVEIGRIVRSPK